MNNYSVTVLNEHLRQTVEKIFFDLYIAFKVKYRLIYAVFKLVDFTDGNYVAFDYFLTNLLFTFKVVFYYSSFRGLELFYCVGFIAFCDSSGFYVGFVT